MNKLFFIFVSTFFIQTSLKAGILIEPNVGYIISGKSNSSVLSASGYNFDVSYKYSNIDYGAKLGYSYLFFNTGLSYGSSNFTQKYTLTCTNASNVTGTMDDNKITRTSLGAFVGFDAFIIRGWVNYLFSVKDKVTETNSSWTSGDTNKGTGLEFGLGYSPFPLISLNMLYRSMSYKSSVSSTTGDKAKTTEIATSISVPINL